MHGALRLHTQALTGAAILSGTLNRVLYRMALVPMGDFTFALATFQNITYVLVYFALVAWRYRCGWQLGAHLLLPWQALLAAGMWAAHTRHMCTSAPATRLPSHPPRAQVCAMYWFAHTCRLGLVTSDMLVVPGRGRFVLTGACEAAGQLLLMIGAANLPAALLPLLVPTGLLWSMLFTRIILDKRCVWVLVCACGCVRASVWVLVCAVRVLLCMCECVHAGFVVCVWVLVCACRFYCVRAGVAVCTAPTSGL